MANKKALRAHFRQIQLSFSPDRFQEWNEVLALRLEAALQNVTPGSFVAAYQARPREANPASLFRLPFRWCFPLVLSLDGEMEFRWVEKAAVAAEFHAGAYGILEPRLRHPRVEKEKISHCLVPLLAFDEQGTRLGHGKGFYDRFLHQLPAQKIGLAFEWQKSKIPLPADPHDEKLDLVVTERETYFSNR